MEWYKLNQSDIFSLISFDYDVFSDDSRPSREDYIMAFGCSFEFYGLKHSYTTFDMIATFQILYDEEHNEVLFTGVGVHPSYRNKGFGHNIIYNIEQLTNNKILRCESRSDNIKMERLLLSHNFTLINEMDTWKTWKKIKQQ